MRPTEEQIMKAVYESGIHQYIPEVLIGGSSSSYLKGFAAKLTESLTAQLSAAQEEIERLEDDNARMSTTAANCLARAEAAESALAAMTEEYENLASELLAVENYREELKALRAELAVLRLPQ